MGVKSCYLKAGSRVGPIRKLGGEHEYRETWVVIMDRATDKGLVVEQANALPDLGSAFADDASAICESRIPRETAESPKVWNVEVAYRSVTPGTREEKPRTPEEAIQLPPRRWWTTLPIQTYPLTDIVGLKFANSAGDPFDPPPLMFQHHRVLHLVANRLDFDAAKAEDYIDSINTDPITVDKKDYPRFAGKIITFDGQQIWLNNKDLYWEVTIEIEFNPDLWFPYQEVDK
ncbi:MAG: hypothetical protein ACYTF6_13645, partial [Planctomycetota bacterium]